MRVVWRPNAIANLAEIVAYIAADNPSAARAMQARIEDAATDIAQQPLIYRIGRVPGTRELVVHPNYIVIYRVLPDWIEVVGVMHARRKYP